MSERLRKIAGAIVGALRAIFVRNFHLKAIALLLTFALHLWVGEDRETQMIAAAPVQFSVPEDQILLQPQLDRVKLTLRGRWSSLNRFDQNDLEPVVVELSQDHDGEIVPITPDSVRLPAGVRTVSIDPSAVRVKMADRVTKKVAVRPRIVGRPRSSYIIEDVSLRPETLEVAGPRNVIDQLEAIPTERIDVTGRARSFQKSVQLRPESPHLAYDVNRTVTVSVTIKAEEVQRTIQNVKVRAVNTTQETTIEPATLDLTIRGPRSLVEELDRSTIHAVIDLSKEDQREPGTFDKTVQIKNLPDEVARVRTHPKHFVVTTLPRETNGAGTDNSQSEN